MDSKTKLRALTYTLLIALIATLCLSLAHYIIKSEQCNVTGDRSSSSNAGQLSSNWCAFTRASETSYEIIDPDHPSVMPGIQCPWSMNFGPIYRDLVNLVNKENKADETAFDFNRNIWTLRGLIDRLYTNQADVLLRLFSQRNTSLLQIKKIPPIHFIGRLNLDGDRKRFMTDRRHAVLQSTQGIDSVITFVLKNVLERELPTYSSYFGVYDSAQFNPTLLKRINIDYPFHFDMTWLSDNDTFPFQYLALTAFYNMFVAKPMIKNQNCNNAIIDVADLPTGLLNLKASCVADGSIEFENDTKRVNDYTPVWYDPVQFVRVFGRAYFIRSTAKREAIQEYAMAALTEFCSTDLTERITQRLKDVARGLVWARSSTLTSDVLNASRFPKMAYIYYRKIATALYTSPLFYNSIEYDEFFKPAIHLCKQFAMTGYFNRRGVTYENLNPSHLNLTQLAEQAIEFPFFAFNKFWDI